MANPVTPKHYVPQHLSKKDKKQQRSEIAKSRALYKRGKYHTRRKVKSFKSKKSSHVTRAKKMYNIDTIAPSRALARKTGCSLKSLKTIMKKGQGAYYSSGSRPNQTAHSWGVARLASAITGGPSSRIDRGTLKRGCKRTSRALRMARRQ
jgi:hypothetical protein